VQADPVQPRVSLIVPFAGLVQGVTVGECTHVCQHAGEGSRLRQVVFGTLVVFGDGHRAVPADQSDQHGQGQGLGREPLLHDQGTQRGGDHQEVVGEKCSLGFRLPQLVPMLAPVGQHSGLGLIHVDSSSAARGWPGP
jgi:hypothetical protein